MRDFVIVNNAVGMRGAWVAAVQWALRDILITAPRAIGVSSGAHNLISLIAGHHSQYTWTDVLTSRNIFDPRRLLHLKRPANTRYLVDHHLSQIDLNRVLDPARQLYVGAFNVTAARTEYPLATRQNIDQLMLSTVTYPFVAPLVRFPNGQWYADGGTAEPSPLRYTITELRAKKIIVFGGYPEHHQENNPGYLSSLLAFPYLWAGPARQALRSRGDAYRKSMALINNPPDGVRIFPVLPPEFLPLDNFTGNQKAAQRVWNEGTRYGESIRTSVAAFVAS